VLILKIIFFKYFFDAFQNEKYFELESLLYSHTPPLVSVKMKDGRKQPLLVNIKKKQKTNCSSMFTLEALNDINVVQMLFSLNNLNNNSVLMCSVP
jgi:hypothetical protein